MIRRAAIAAFAVALVAACSSGPSAEVRGRRVCAAFETFWDTDYLGGPVPANLAAAKGTLLAALGGDHHKALDDAARGVVAGELSIPPIRHGESASQYTKDLAAVPKQSAQKLSAVGKDDRLVEAQCDALGRHVNG